MTEKVVRYGSAGLGCTLIPDDTGEWVPYSDYEALQTRVEELEEAITYAIEVDKESVAEIQRLREALECCADMLRRVDSGRATEAAIDFAMDAARAALQEPTE